jgi:hypothetical protein
MDVASLAEKQSAKISFAVSPRKNGGKRPGAGRKKGVPNKLTADMKATIVAAFVDAGGKD